VLIFCRRKNFSRPRLAVCSTEQTSLRPLESSRKVCRHFAPSPPEFCKEKTPESFLVFFQQNSGGGGENRSRVTKYNSSLRSNSTKCSRPLTYKILLNFYASPSRCRRTCDLTKVYQTFSPRRRSKYSRHAVAFNSARRTYPCSAPSPQK
jgi:hypothetical protein